MKYINTITSVFLAVSLIFLPGTSYSVTDSGDQAKAPEVLSVSLDECIRYALHNSFEVKLAKLDLYIAETDKLYAEAVFDTFVYGDVGYVEDRRQPVSVFSGDGRQTNTYSLGISKELQTGTQLSATWGDTRNWVNNPFVTVNPAHDALLMMEVSQPVGKNFFGYVDRTNLSVTKLAIKNAGLRMQDRIEALVAEVEKAYWDIVYAARSVEIQTDMVAKANRLYDANVKNFDMGIVERADLLASEANVLIKEKDLMIAENTFKNSGENLKLLINMPAAEDLVPSEVFNKAPMDFDLAECLKTAFENRRDYKIRERDVKIQGLTLKMKGNEMWPEIDLKQKDAFRYKLRNRVPL